MDEIIRRRLTDALEARGKSAIQVSLAIGYDRGYLIDFVSGRKKSITADAFMKAADHLGMDPWFLSGLGERRDTVRRGETDFPEPSESPVSEIDISASSLSVPSRTGMTAMTDRLPLSGIAEEMAFRQPPGGSDISTFSVMASQPSERQSVFEVRGKAYLRWGLGDGVIVYALRFGRYETVVSTGKLLVRVRSIGQGLSETVIRRVEIDGDGGLFLEAPDGSKSDYAEGSDGYVTAGMIVQEISLSAR